MLKSLLTQMRDNIEGERLINRLDDAKTEKLIRDVADTTPGA